MKQDIIYFFYNTSASIAEIAKDFSLTQAAVYAIIMEG